MKRYLAVGVLCVLGMSVGNGQEKAGHPADDHIIVRPATIKWGPAPPSLPAGAQMAVLAGNPGKKGVHFVMRAKLPDGYKVPAHWHPSNENVTVIKGMLLIGRGDKFDAARLEELPAGSYMQMPKEMRHFATAKGETILQVHGIGPFEVNYVNPADDPRTK